MGSQRVKLTNIFTNLNEQNPSFLTVQERLLYCTWSLYRLTSDIMGIFFETELIWDKQSKYKYAFLRCLKALQIKHAVKSFLLLIFSFLMCAVWSFKETGFASLPGAVCTPTRYNFDPWPYHSSPVPGNHHR